MANPEIETIIGDPDGTETLVKFADRLGQDLKGVGLTTSQIRALFGEVRSIESEWPLVGELDEKREKYMRALRRLILLKPKMAYRARRERGRGVQVLVEVLDTALNEVIKEKNAEQQTRRFQRFVEFFEAILAYHKAYGGN